MLSDLRYLLQTAQSSSNTEVVYSRVVFSGMCSPRRVTHLPPARNFFMSSGIDTR